LSEVSIHLLSGSALAERMPDLTAYAQRERLAWASHDPAWLYILRDGMGHVPFAFEAVQDGVTRGWLPLAYVRSTLFGRYLVSMPYLNTAGVRADNDAIAQMLINHAALFARDLQVKHLELRHEKPVEHPLLGATRTTKVHMRLALPSFPGPLWEGLNFRVRNRVRKGEKGGMQLVWGGLDLVNDFYEVFSRNMRDLGTPVYGRRLFVSILRHLGDRAELCVVRKDHRPIAVALLLHGKGVTEVPSSSSLKEFNSTCANVMMYWHLIERAIQREQEIFDFGRSTIDSNTFVFKKQWGAKPEPATWQYHLLSGEQPGLQPDNPRFERLIKIWQRLPVGVTRLIGPRIVRGIP
jgi:FemAB-related protein (PEP-CTERM system-associated)